MLWLKILKWLAVVAGLLVILTLVAVWGVLGVNPFEGKVDHLWQLVSNEVDFFVRVPGTQVLDEDLILGIEGEEGYGILAELRLVLADLTRDVAREVNPAIPFGLVEVDAEKDFFGKEMAFAGAIRNDYQHLKLDNFIVLTRVPTYARFLSALKRGFVRSRIPVGADRIEVVSGLYFKVKLDPATTRALNRFRTLRGGSTLTNELFLARIGDVVALSDSDIWIEHALQRGGKTIPADPWFESEFIRTSPEGRSVELYVRTILSAHVLLQHGRPESGTLLSHVAKLMPVQITGDLTVRARTLPADAVEVTLSDVPPEGGFEEMEEHLQVLYHREKADLHVDMSEDGIGRFIPRERTVAALVLHAKSEELVDLILSSIGVHERRLLDDQARDTGGRSFERVLRVLAEDLKDTHLMVIHRPSVFDRDGRRWRNSYDVDFDDTMPEAQFSFSIVSQVRDSVPTDKVRQRFYQHLPNLGLKPMGVHASTGLSEAEPIGTEELLTLVKPAYGSMPGNQPFVVLSSSREGAEAIFRAAQDESARLISLQGVADAIAKLPRVGTMALIADASVLHQGLLDQVRDYARLHMDIMAKRAEFQNRWDKSGKKGNGDDYVDGLTASYVAAEYPKQKERYERSLAWLRSVDWVALSANLGVGPEKKVKATAIVQFGIAE